MGIEYGTEARATGIKLAQSLGVRDVKSLNADLEFVSFTPWHREALAQAHVEIHITRNTEDVAVAGFSRLGIPEAAISIKRIAAKQLWRLGYRRHVLDRVQSP